MVTTNDLKKMVKFNDLKLWLNLIANLYDLK
jgi:hypothetical protein